MSLNSLEADLARGASQQCFLNKLNLSLHFQSPGGVVHESVGPATVQIHIYLTCHLTTM